MFDFDWLREITSTMGKNKMRTFLTGLAVAWGIFLFIILLGSGNGLKHGMQSNFQGRATNAITVWPGYSSMPYKGLPTNRKVRFDHKDYDLIRNKMPNVEYVSARVSKFSSLAYEKEYGTWELMGVSPDAVHINNIKIKSGSGRFLNKLDVDKKRKVIVINDKIKDVLFKHEEPIGKYIIADNNIAYQVVGLYENDSDGDTPPAYIPFTTAQSLYSQGYGFGRIDFTVTGLLTEEANDKYIELLRDKMGKLHSFDGKDRSALYLWNTAKDSIETEQIFGTISLFIIIIGIASLMAGIVGVGNIMLVTVKERTREIGIRKAIGARPRSILKLIIMESILITTVAGYVGIVMGVGLTELISSAMSGVKSDGPSIFKDPTVDLSTVIYATIFLIVCGVIAGLIPAVKATKVSPIEAMRAE